MLGCVRWSRWRLSQARPGQGGHSCGQRGGGRGEGQKPKKKNSAGAGDLASASWRGDGRLQDPWILDPTRGVGCLPLLLQRWPARLDLTYSALCCILCHHR